MVTKNGVSLVAVVVAVFALVVLAFGSFFTVDPGEIAVKTRMGQVIDSYGEGIHFKLPVIESVHRISMRIVRDDIKTDAFSKDLQAMTVHLAINHRIEKENAISVYRNLGADYMASIIDPAAQEVLKAITAKYTAEMLVSNRDAIVEAVNNDLKVKLKEKQIIVTDVSIVDMDFSSEFLGAVERKQIAEQDAKTAQNQVAVAKAKAESTIASAKAEAESLRVQKAQVTDQMIQMRAVEKWDGVMPKTIVGKGALPFIKLGE